MPSESINDDARCRRVITYGLVIWRERNMQHNQSRSRDSPAFGFHPTSFCDLGTKLYGDDDTGDEALRRDFAAAFKRLTELGFVEFPPITQFPADAAVRGDVARCPFNEHGYGYPLKSLLAPDMGKHDSKPGDYDAVRASILEQMDDDTWDDGSYAPILIRLAWHSSGTFCATTRTGGSNGATM